MLQTGKIRIPNIEANCRRKQRARKSRGRATKKFTPEIMTTSERRSSGHPAEAVLEFIAREQGLVLIKEKRGFAITYSGRKNGKQGSVWFDFEYHGVFMEVAFGSDLEEKLHEINQVRDRYGYEVILITPDKLAELEARPALLIQWIEAAEHSQAEGVNSKQLKRSPQKRRREARNAAAAISPQPSRPQTARGTARTGLSQLEMSALVARSSRGGN